MLAVFNDKGGTVKRLSPLLFLTSKILETEPYRSDRFEVGFGLATAAR
jgi:hypothetical protein